MRNYNNFSYKPDYGFELYKDNRLVENQQSVRGAVCFSWVFNLLDRYSSQTVFKGIYTLKCRKTFVKCSGNYCVLSKENVIKVVNVIRKNFGTQVTVKETDDNFEFKFTVVGKPIKHKFILTFSRVFFEYPYNEFAQEVFRLKELGKLDNINITNVNFLTLYHLVQMSYDSWGGGHSLFSCPQTTITYKTLLEKFDEGCRRVQEIYPGDYNYFRNIRNNKSTSFDWDNDFDVRVKRYSNNFQILKKLKQNEHKENIRRRKRA